MIKKFINALKVLALIASMVIMASETEDNGYWWIQIVAAIIFTILAINIRKTFKEVN